MTAVIAWVTFAGAWLLVAGPLYQGWVELDEFDVDREGIEGIKTSAVPTAQGAGRRRSGGCCPRSCTCYTAAGPLAGRRDMLFDLVSSPGGSRT
jgi:hypothetical protein